MITIENVRAAVPGRVVLEHCTATLETGSVTHLVGANGSGKSTLIRAIAGIQRYSGNIHFDGRDVARVRSGLYVCFDDAPVFPYLNGYDNIRLLTGRQLSRKHIAEIAPAIADHGLLKFSARKLSHGQRKRLHLVAAFASEARYLLLDEALNGLDTPSVTEFDSALRGRGSTATVLLTGHHDETYRSLAHHRIELRDGQLVSGASAAGVAS